jgi:hypothetical protein
MTLKMNKKSSQNGLKFLFKVGGHVFTVKSLKKHGAMRRFQWVYAKGADNNNRGI